MAELWTGPKVAAPLPTRNPKKKAGWAAGEAEEKGGGAGDARRTGAVN